MLRLIGILSCYQHTSLHLCRPASRPAETQHFAFKSTPPFLEGTGVESEGSTHANKLPGQRDQLAIKVTNAWVSPLVGGADLFAEDVAFAKALRPRMAGD
jgi:hypothetical protein